MRILSYAAALIMAAVVCMTLVGCKNGNGESAANTDDSNSGVSTDPVEAESSETADSDTKSIVDSTSSSSEISDDPGIPVIVNEAVAGTGHSGWEDPSVPVNGDHTSAGNYENDAESRDEYELPIIPVS